MTFLKAILCLLRAKFNRPSQCSDCDHPCESEGLT